MKFNSLSVTAILASVGVLSGVGAASAQTSPATPEAAAPAAPTAGAPSMPPGPAAQAAMAAAMAAPVYDPFEPANRGSYRFSQGLDRYVIRPVALGYKAVLPGPVRTGVRNMIDNINTPNVALNDLLQARPQRFLDSSGRFIINSTLGIGGLFDVAAKVGIAKHQADFGQTMGRWGLQPGPYFYLPVIGPTDLRDGLGTIVDSFTGLLNIHDLHVDTWPRFGIAVVDGIDTRATLDPMLEDLNRSSTDPYVTIRSIYMQNRQSMVTDTATAVDQLPSFDAPPAAGAATAPHS